jgi:hypothetical protein
MSLGPIQFGLLVGIGRELRLAVELLLIMRLRQSPENKARSQVQSFAIRNQVFLKSVLAEPAPDAPSI